MEICRNFDLSSSNTFHIRTVAGSFASFSSVDELKDLLQKFKIDKPLVLGGGSNVLFTKDYYEVVIQNELKGIQIVDEDEDFVWVKAGAGVMWHELVMYCVDSGWGGIENLSLIPGSVGAAPMQNIGAYGAEIKDIFFELQAMNITDYHIRNFSNEECRFGYRESIFKQELKGQYIILNVTCKLKKKPVLNISYGSIATELQKMDVKVPDVRSVSDAVIRIRSSKLPNPNELGNAGSFFKNPVISADEFEHLKNLYPDVPSYNTAGGVKVPAAWLIEQCGFKGHREGNVGCHKTQPLVIVNYGGATGTEVFALSQKIEEAVQAKFGVCLSREVNIY